MGMWLSRTQGTKLSIFYLNKLQGQVLWEILELQSKQIERSTKGSTGSSSLCVMRASRLFRDQLFVISEKIFLFTISKVASSLSLIV